jgi:hypothetical protein
MFTLGAAQSFDAILYGEDHPNTISYLQNQFTGNVGNTLNDAARNIYEKAKQTFEYFNSAEAMQFTRKAIQSVKGIFQANVISHLCDLTEMQAACSTMQRWIMSNPNVREQYHLQKCEGYADTYIDYHPKDITENHYDYRRVMDGMFVFDEKDDWKVNIYLDDLIEGDRHLVFEEQCDIVSTWTKMDILMALGGKDPTSSVGSGL